jgi:catecholate siderophore receptor
VEIKLRKATRKKRNGRAMGPRYWVIATGAMGAIIAFTLGNSRAMTVGYVDNASRTVTARKSDASDKYDFNIPAGTLAEVAEAFERQTGIKVSISDSALKDLPSPGVTGSLTASQALSLLLKGTGLSFTAKDEKNVDLKIEAVAATVEIYSSNTGTIASPKYTEPLRDTPKTVNIVSRETIEQQNATTLRDVLNNVPGITIAAGEGGAPAGDNLTIRGFSARNDIYVDGARDLGAQSRDSFNLEQVEVVKGPSSTFTGRGSTGGTINLVNKLPNLRRTIAGTLTAGNANTKRATADINLPLGDTIAFRLNAMGHDSDYPGREAVRNRRWGIAPSIGFGLGTRTRFGIEYFHLGQNNTSDYGIPWVPAANAALIDYRDRPAPVPRSTFYGFVDRDHEKLRSDLLTLRFERDFNDNLHLRNQFRYGASSRDSIATPPRFTNNTTTSINRELRSWIVEDDIFDNQADVTYSFKTGPVEHGAVVGGLLSHEESHRVLRTGPNSLTTLLNPNPFDIYTGTIVINPLEGDLEANTAAVYFYDTIKFGTRWQVVGGLRFDRFAAEGFNVNTTPVPNVLVPLNRVDNILSGRAALVYKPIEAGSIYASYATSASPSLEGLLYSPADIRTDPEKTKTLEIGTKWDFFKGRFLVSGAVFQVRKDNARTPSLIAGDAPTLDGDQRVRGLEFSATGNITRGWQIVSAYTFLDSEIVRSNTPPTLVNGVLISEVGKELLNTPRNSFNLWTTYQWKKLFLGGGPRHVGKRFGNNINTRFVDAYWTVDGLVSYKLTDKIDLRMNMTNIGDRYFIDRIGGGHIVPGPGRSITFTTGFNF